IVNFDLHSAGEVNFGEADVSVFVALDVLKPGHFFRVELLDQSFGEHRDPVLMSERATLDDGPFDYVADFGEGDRLLTKFLSDYREGGSGGFADAKREVARLSSHRNDDVPALCRLRVFDQVSHKLNAGVACGLITKSRDVTGERQIVVDGLWDVYNADLAARAFGYITRRERGVVTANGHQMRDSERPERADYGVDGCF